MTDADAATWGEYSACTSRPGAFVHLRVGTGVACGIVVDDRLQPTDADRTTHWKVLVVDDHPDAIACPCGLRGCLETIASGPALEAQARKMGWADGLLGLQKAWQRRSPSSLGVVDGCARLIAVAAHKVCGKVQAIGNSTATVRERVSALDASCPLPHELGSDRSGGSPLASARGSNRQDACDAVVCLGGGVITALPCLFERTAVHFWSGEDDFTRRVTIYPSRLGDDAGVIGAALLARDAQSESPLPSEPQAYG
jgi:predicted NBD/HSP70 family sugar kinase